MIIFTPNTLLKSAEVNDNFAQVKKDIYPVGSVYINATVGTNPGTLLGFGTWVAFGAGRVPVGIDASQVEFDTIAETGGAKTHTLTTAEIPAHNHQTNIQSNIANSGPYIGGQGALSGDYTQNTGGGGSHNNLQPYIVVYMWQRTA